MNVRVGKSLKKIIDTMSVVISLKKMSETSQKSSTYNCNFDKSARTIEQHRLLKYDPVLIEYVIMRTNSIETAILAVFIIFQSKHVYQ